MRAKPKGPEYKFLLNYRGSIWYRRQSKDPARRILLDTGCSTWTEAAQWKRSYEAQEAKTKPRPTRRPVHEARTFGEVAALYLERPSRLGELSENTVKDKQCFLRPNGPIIEFFGQRPVNSITVKHLEEWWAREVIDRGLSLSHGKNSINTISLVIKKAVAEGWAESNPVPMFRERLRDALKTKAGRAQEDSKANPIERREDIATLVEAAMAEDSRSAVAVLLLLDTGMRLAEAEALTWGQIGLGSDDDAGSRSILVDRARVCRDYEAKPKSGRSRRVQMSRRLRRALVDFRKSRFNPAPDRRVLEGFHAGNFRNRQWRRILERAGIGHWKPKDLRDTFASHLLTRGINPAYVAKQLGHSDWSVTARHYARWTAGDYYVEPERLEAGEVPADLLSRHQTNGDLVPLVDLSYGQRAQKS